MDETRELTTDEQLKLGRDAKDLLENPLLTAAFEAVLENCRRDIEFSEPLDPMKREEAYFILRGMRKFQVLLTDFVISGSLSAEQDAEEKRLVEEHPPEFESEHARRAWYNR